MTNSFSNLKRNSGSLEKLSKAIEALNTGASYEVDKEKYFKPEVDKAGNGMATIRFLPAPAIDGDDGLPWAKLFSHGFKGPTGTWLIDNCPTTNGDPCPICDENSTLWNTGTEPNKNIVRTRKRKLNYISNVYIVSDPKHPENNGTVKLFKYGKKIFDKIDEAMNPQFEDEQPINPFDMWKGANFKLKIRKVEGFQNYDKSEFEAPSSLLDDDAELEKIWQSELSLKVLTDPKEFKSYDELKKRLDRALGLTGAVSNAPKSVEQARAAVAKMMEDPEGDPPPWDENRKTPAVDITDDEDGLEYFQKLAESE